MHITKLFPKTVLASSLFLVSAWAVAHEGHHSDPSTETQEIAMPAMDHSKMNHSQMNHENMNHASMNHGAMDHSQHQQKTVSAPEDHTAHQGHDHRKEHGAQIYAITTVDNKWLLNEDGKGALKSEIETRIGTDENKVFLKAHIDKHESHDAEYDFKMLYSRMISDFWDAQIGVRYRVEKVERDQRSTDTEEKLDGVIGLHGMAPYFFETDAYLYVGEDNYSGFSLETERDLLLTQKLIVRPYLNVDVVFNDESKYAKKSGLSAVTTGIETRYEISKKVMPYIDIAYEYSKGNDATPWQVESDSEKGWLYGAGIRFKF
ncbi:MULTISPECIES: copper resistance protein B [Acinetobacter]|jgi:copper resistance protein B|uniref:copper resistance protein B n=1 Tax=Acinetobacter TaxID=469 RepID=UPI000B3BED2E|nr:MULTISPECIES: copper resistance protein B [Acinetobacter]AXY59268.1 copper resistance protein B [Acinetobacter sp. WCHAc010052]WOE42235.1 copper resistance protein B [Acinetobacter chinensis]